MLRIIFGQLALRIMDDKSANLQVSIHVFFSATFEWTPLQSRSRTTLQPEQEKEQLTQLSRFLPCPPRNNLRIEKKIIREKSTTLSSAGAQRGFKGGENPLNDMICLASFVILVFIVCLFVCDLRNEEFLGSLITQTTAPSVAKHFSKLFRQIHGAIQKHFPRLIFTTFPIPDRGWGFGIARIWVTKKQQKMHLKRDKLGTIGFLVGFSTIPFFELSTAKIYNIYLCVSSCIPSAEHLFQAPVVWRLDNAIQQINRYPADKC